MSEERTLTLDEVRANALDKLNELQATDPGYGAAAKAVEVLFRYGNEPDKVDVSIDELESNERIEMAKIEVERERLELDKRIFEQTQIQSDIDKELKEKELRNALIDSILKSTVIGVCIGEVSWHVGAKLIAVFEENGTWRSLASKLWMSALRKKK